MNRAPPAATTNAAPPAAPLCLGLGSGAWKRIGLGAVIVFACLLPFCLSSYRTFQITLVLVNALALLGINMLTGFNGQISLGHGAFYAIGAYTAAVLISQFGVPYWATLPVAGIVCLAAGFAFGLPVLRLEGLYLALATLALGLVMPQLLKYKGIQEWTGGVQGIVIDKPEAPVGWLDPDRWLYFLALFVVIVMFFAASNLLRGRVGRALVAIRDQPIAAAAMGINTALYKSLAFGVSALYTGVAGALGAVAVQFVAPGSFELLLSFSFLVGSVVGGIFSISGAVYGALFLVFVPNFADQLSRAAPWAIFGVLLIVFVYLMPTGIAGFLRLAGTRLWRKTDAGTARR